MGVKSAGGGPGPGCTAELAESLVEVLYASAALDSF